MMYWNDHGMNGWGYGLMTVGMLLLWGLIILGVVALVRYLGRGPQHHLGTPPDAPASDARPTPEQLLAERFALGEIDADEYRDRLEALHSGSGPSTGPTAPRS